jgi:hypothetical protein
MTSIQDRANFRVEVYSQRMLNCPGCGLTNRPYETDCALCELPLQDAAGAAAKRKEWDALPATIREEQEKAFDRMRSGTLEHREWLKNHRVAHAILGGLLVSFPMNGSVFFASLWSLPIDLAVGAAAGLLLNRLKGGSWHGIGIFVGAAVVSVILRAPFLNMTEYLKGYWFFTCFAVMMVSGGGYMMGMKLDYEHRDHSMTN